MLAIVALLAGLLSQRTVSGNFPRDLYGPIDTREQGISCNVGPCIWGHADSATIPIQFSPPSGYQVRITEIRGNLIAWLKYSDHADISELRRAAGVLVGFQTSSSGPSPDCNYCAAGCPLYLQGALTESADAITVPFDYRTDLVLDADNVLIGKIAEFLNTAGPIHMELTYSLTYRFEPVGGTIVPN